MRSLSKSKWMEAVQSYVLYFFFYYVDFSIYHFKHNSLLIKLLCFL